VAETVPTESHLKEELVVLAEEGFDTSAPAARLETIAGLETEYAAEVRHEIAEMIKRLPRRPGFGYDEPSDLAVIRAARPMGPRKLPGNLGKRLLADRTLGAWLGRAAGCLLGKPCEGWPRERIERTLRAFGEWPLSDYWPSVADLPPGFRFSQHGQPAEPGALEYHRPEMPWLRGNIKRMARDDDMDYPIIGLHILERYGPQFTTANVGDAWLDCLPHNQVYTAERVAYRNLVDGLEPPETATYRNPYREWIGAQIRADIWGWVCPGKPELAAELAWRDASLSHTKNGIYGEMFFAALTAAAFAPVRQGLAPASAQHVRELIEIGLSEIPHNCRLREAVLDTVEWCDTDPNWERSWDRINGKYGHYHCIHTINNAAVVLMGLLHAKGDYEKAIAIAVMGGWDTDCNGATAGAVMGTMLGAKALPEKWVGPLHDRISSIVIGSTDTKLSALAKRTGAVQEAAAAAYP
jgi:ADP-ribosylglycohydrolase